MTRMTDQTDNLSIISTERRVWLLLVDERENGAESRVGERIEELAYVLERHSDAHRLITINERLDEPWQTAGPRLGENDDHWHITFSRPLTKAEWYVAGPGGRTAEVSTEVVARLDAIQSETAEWEAQRNGGEPADDGEPSEAELERIANNVGRSRWEQVQR
jgi:hypothetical protein